MPDEILTPQEVADLFKLKNVKTVYAWAQAGKIPSHHIGGSLRFFKQELIDFFKNK